jgi:hypothetical protein
VLSGAAKQTVRLRLVVAAILAYWVHCYPPQVNDSMVKFGQSVFNVIPSAAHDLGPLMFLVSLQSLVVITASTGLLFRPQATPFQVCT